MKNLKEEFKDNLVVLFGTLGIMAIIIGVMVGIIFLVLFFLKKTFNVGENISLGIAVVPSVAVGITLLAFVSAFLKSRK